MLVQHRYKEQELKAHEEDFAAPVIDEDVQPEAENQEEAEKQEEEEPAEERGEEAHEEYAASEHDQNEELKEPYDPNEFWTLEANSKNKVKSLKKSILEKIGLQKKADIVLMKEIKDHEVDESKKNEAKIEQFAGSSQKWLQLTEKELDDPVKVFADKSLAFKAFMNISVEVMGRGQSYKQSLTVDPKDGLE